MIRTNLEFAHCSISSSLRRLSMVAFASMAVAASLAGLNAQTIPVPNGSFESPGTPPGFPAFPVVSLWQKTPQPPGFPLPPGYNWDQLAGVFPNTAFGQPDHIDNVDGAQAAYMLAIPGVSLFQEIGSPFQVGKSYNLKLGILGGGGITPGSTFEMSLYYRDGANNLVSVAATPITYSAAAFPNTTHLIDYEVTVPPVQAADAWAGQKIGVQLTSTFGTGAGYWDVDNVRLQAVPEPGSVAVLALGVGGLLVARWRSRKRA